MTSTENIITIFVVILGTMLTRFLPFLIFPANKKTPPLIIFLGKILPSSIMGMLVVYTLKDISFNSSAEFLPELIAVALTAFLQYFYKNILLTILLGTVCYMFLVQSVFNL